MNLVPPEKLVGFFTDCLKLLKELNANDVGDYLEFGIFHRNSIESIVHSEL